MTLQVCPIANVHAPVQRVWGLLAEPTSYAEWWDASTKTIEPPGGAQPGQRVHATSMAFGIAWNVDVLVERVDEARHELDVMTTLPLGITVFNHIVCRQLDPSSCQVTFG